MIQQQWQRNFALPEKIPDVQTAKAHEWMGRVEREQEQRSLVLAQKTKPKTRRFNRNQFFSAGDGDVVDAFLSYWVHRYDYLYKDGSDGWKTATDKWKLSDADILKAVCLESARLFGCRFGRFTCLAVLDVDARGRYHSLEQINRLRTILTGSNLTGHIVYRSSESGGYHIYIPFVAAIRSEDLQTLLCKLLERSGFKIERGHLEVFPNVSPRSKGYGLRLPLQTGFAFLNQITLQALYEREELSSAQAVTHFVNDMISNQNSIDDLRAAIKIADSLSVEKQTDQDDLFSKPSTSDKNVFEMKPAHTYNYSRQFISSPNVQDAAPALEAGTTVKPVLKVLSEAQALASVALPSSCRIAEARSDFEFVLSIWRGQLPQGMKWELWLRGRQYRDTGLTGWSQRSDAISCMSHYRFYGEPARNIDALGYGREQERSQVIRHWLEENHNGFSEEINEGNSDAFDQIDRSCSWRPSGRRESNNDRPEGQFTRRNKERSTRAVERIMKWVELLKYIGVKSQNELNNITGIPRDTLHDHKHVWEHLIDVWNSNKRNGIEQSSDAGSHIALRFRYAPVYVIRMKRLRKRFPKSRTR